jgi:putative SOS response-associated peptidase YedK
MCGRFENAVNREELDAIFSNYIGKLHINYDIEEVLKTEDIAPTDRIRVIILDEGLYKVKVMKWAIRSSVYDPSRKSKGKDPYIEKDLFNSKIETIYKSETWRSLFQNNRCLIPMTAFYEWPVIDGVKKPKRISIENQKCFFAAGIYKEKDTKDQMGASVITCMPNTFIKSIHSRMPLIFTAKEAGNYLNLPFEAAYNISKPLGDHVSMEMDDAKI